MVANSVLLMLHADSTTTISKVAKKQQKKYFCKKVKKVSEIAYNQLSQQNWY
jgi:hypothetical protein